MREKNEAHRKLCASLMGYRGTNKIIYFTSLVILLFRLREGK